MAGLTGATGVSLGAYHAHGLEAYLKKQTQDETQVNSRMDNCATAVQYLMFHVSALLGIGLLAIRGRSRWVTVAGVLTVLGLGGFSGGLFLHVFTGEFIHWSIVPAGGLLLIGAWLALVIAGITLELGRGGSQS